MSKVLLHPQCLTKLYSNLSIQATLEIELNFVHEVVHIQKPQKAKLFLTLQAKDQIEKESEGETKDVLLELLDQLSQKLKKSDYHGSYFDRTAKPAERLCDKKGWFKCEGPFDSRECDKYHTINPYASKGYRQLFGLWNLDHM